MGRDHAVGSRKLLTVDGDPAAAGAKVPGDEVDEGRLPCRVRPHDREDLPWLCLESGIKLETGPRELHVKGEVLPARRGRGTGNLRSGNTFIRARLSGAARADDRRGAAPGDGKDEQ